MRLTHWILTTAMATSAAISGVTASAGTEPVAYINSASGLSVGSTAELHGGNFPANGSITLNITTPQGVRLTDLVVADELGKVSATLPLSETGSYAVEAIDASGEQRANTIVVARPANP